MITIKTPEQIQLMKASGRVLGDLLKYLEDQIKVGMTTKELDRLAYEYIVKFGAKPNFLGYGGFPGTICVSINEQVVHGFPSDRIIKDGDIVSVDTGCILNGWHSDAARTFCMGNVSPEKRKLVEVTRECFFKGIDTIMEGSSLGDLGEAIQRYAESNGFSVVRDMVGHGIGKHLHEDPQVPNYGKRGVGVRLKRGMTLAVEPMINMGGYEVDIDGWKCVTSDGLPSAHYENTVALTDNGVEILTL